MMTLERRLVSVFNNPLTNYNIFMALNKLDVPWSTDLISTQLCYEYMYNHSGRKIISPMVEFILGDKFTLSNNDIDTLAEIIYTMYGDIFRRYWTVFNAEYNPINNYDMTETSTDINRTVYGKTNTVTQTETITYGKTDTRTDDITQTQVTQNVETPDTEMNTSESAYGFNSNIPTPTSETQETQTGTITTDIDTTNTQTGTQTTETSGEDEKSISNSEVLGGQDNNTNEHTLTRKGNIGVTTTQQMLQSEIELWKWNYFRDVVFPAIDKILTIDLY